MGLLDRLIRGVNRAAEPVQRATTLTDGSLARAEAVAASGVAVNGAIVGIRRTSNDGQDEQILAVAVGRGTDEPQRYAIEVGRAAQARLRLGLPVAVRVDGRSAALDWAAMCEAWGIRPVEPLQRSKRRPPHDGIQDEALDWGVQRRLKKGTPGRATITSLERRHVLGMASESWTIQLRLPDGSTAATGADEVPRYAAWYAAPGAEVRCASDPADPTKVTIDWPAVALEGAATARFEDPPPTGSVAAALEADAPG